MFPLHDRVRRRICVAGFILLCIVPTLAVLGWATAWSLPGHVRTEARRIGQRLGMEVSLGRVEHLRPGAVRLGDVVLRDLEQTDAVLHCAALVAELETINDKTDTPHCVLSLRAPTLEVNATQLADLGELARRLLRLRAGNHDVDIRWYFDQIEFRQAGHVAPLTDARGGAQTVEGSTGAWMKFAVSGEKMTRPALVRLVRNRQVGPAADWFLLDTGGAALSCKLLGQAIPAMQSLGTSARFRGYLRAELTQEGWRGQIGSASEDQPSGEFLDIEWNRLVTDHISHTLSGKGHVVIDCASFRKGRLEEAWGTVTSGPGTISPSLLNAAARYLGLTQPRGPMTSSNSVPFDWLAFRFEIRHAALAIRPWHTDSNIVMATKQGDGLLCSTQRSCAAVDMVKVMVPEGTPEIPVTQQADQLLRHLPLPESVPAKSAYGHSHMASGGTRTHQNR